MGIQRYSIWLEPQGQLQNRLSRIIKQLSQEYGTPIFNPHVTLLGDIEGNEIDITRETKDLSTLLKPYIIELTGEVVCEEVWSRAMIVLAKQTPQVMQANESARKVFKIHTQDLYIPHLSLMYTKSKPVDIETRRKIAQEFDPNLLKGSFEVTSINLCRIYEEIEKWDKVKEFPI